MKLLVLLTLVVILVLFVGGNWSLQVTIILPPALVPYYEWLVSFPGFQQVPENPSIHKTWTESG